jgi:uncharacterized protein (TIGR03435 family)
MSDIMGVSEAWRSHPVRSIQHSAATYICSFTLVFFCLPFAVAQAQQHDNAVAMDKLPSFEVAAIKPSRPDDESRNWNSGNDRLSIKNYTLRRLIRMAYALKSDSQILGGPEWIGKRSFDIEAKFGDAEFAKMQKMSGREKFEETRFALQALLAERFQLQIRQEAQSIPVYALVVAKTESKLASSAPQLDADGKPKAEKNHSIHHDNGHVVAQATSMSSLADGFVYLSECDRVVVDRTGLIGEYDFKLDWTEDRGQGVAADASLPGLFTALREQLGLELKPDKSPVNVVVVESAKEPELD